jgi:hypothetical protein
MLPMLWPVRRVAPSGSEAEEEPRGGTVGYVHAPRLTRLLAGMWSAHAVADFVQLAYSSAEKRA